MKVDAMSADQSQAPKLAGATAADVQVYQKWSETKIQEWEQNESSKLRKKFKTLADLKAWLKEKGTQAHLQTQHGRANQQSLGKPRSSRVRSEKRMCSDGCSLVAGIVVFIVLVSIATAIASAITSGRSGPASSYIRRDERTCI